MVIAVNIFVVYSYFNLIFLAVLGILVGMEIPLLTRILKEYGSLKDILSNVLSFDYLGGLIISIVYPLVLYPYFGFIKTAFSVGILNILIGLYNTWVFSDKLTKRDKMKIYPWGIAGIAILLFGFFTSSSITGWFQQKLYFDPLLKHVKTKYQTIDITVYKNDLRLYLDGALQFSSLDEYRYHEALVYPAFMFNPDAEKVLVLGGGDGLAVREILKFRSVKEVVLVDLDKVITDLATEYKPLAELNEYSLSNPKVTVYNMDAKQFLSKGERVLYDIIIADFPDPHNEIISMLYSKGFYQLVEKNMSTSGIFISQSTSPSESKEAFWCINKTIKEIFRNVVPYHIHLKSMWNWGFNLAANKTIQVENPEPDVLPQKKKFFDEVEYQKSLLFSDDMILKNKEEIMINTFEEPILYKYFLEGWDYVR